MGRSGRPTWRSLSRHGSSAKVPSVFRNSAMHANSFSLWHQCISCIDFGPLLVLVSVGRIRCRSTKKHTVHGPDRRRKFEYCGNKDLAKMPGFPVARYGPTPRPREISGQPSGNFPKRFGGSGNCWRNGIRAVIYKAHSAKGRPYRRTAGAVVVGENGGVDVR